MLVGREVWEGRGRTSGPHVRGARPLPAAAVDPRALRVAIHLRRSDVDGSFRRFVHDENVTRALDWIGDVARSVAPALAVDVHIFTSIGSRPWKYTRRFWTSADFDVFRRRGVTEL